MQATYSYASGWWGVDDARAARQRALPDGADVFDESARGVGARVPALGDGIYRASVEGGDGNALVWVHLVAYGSGRDGLADLTADVRRKLERRNDDD